MFELKQPVINVDLLSVKDIYKSLFNSTDLRYSSP